MIFTPRKKIIASPFRQRGNVVSFFPGPDPGVPEIDTFVLSQLKDFSAVAGIDLLVGMWVSADGGKLVVADQNAISPDTWVQYSLTSVFDLATLTAQESARNYVTPVRISGVFLTEDGLQMRSVSRSPTNAFIRNTVLSDFSPPFNIASVGQQSAFNIGTSAFGIHFSADGLKLYTVSNSTLVREHTLTTPFDPVTATLTNTFETNAQTTIVRAITFGIDGTRMFVADLIDDIVDGVIYQYDLGTAFDVSTAAFSGKSISAEDAGPSGLHLVGDDKLFVSYDGVNGTLGVRKFIVAGNFPPVPPPEIASNYQLDTIGNANPGFASGNRFDVFWKQDGLRVWTGRQNGTERQYDVSPAWSIVGSPSDWTLDFETPVISNLRSLWWSADGTVFSDLRRLPATSITGVVYDQSATPFDFTVLGSSTSKSWTPTGGATPQDHVWSEDGTRLWIHCPIGITSPLCEFSVPIPFDMTSLVTAQVKSFDFALTPAGTGVNTFTFSPDGLILYMMVGQALSSFDFGVAFDIDTLHNFVSGPTVPAGNVTIPRGLSFREDTEDIFVAGDQNTRQLAFFSVIPPLPTGIITVGAGVAYGQVAVAGNMVFTLPAHNAGDLLLLAHYIARTDDVNDFVLVTTAGWTELAAAERRVFSGTAMTQRVWTKIGDGVETQVTVNNQYAGGAGFSLACVAIDGVDTVDIFDPTPITAHSKLQNNSSNPTAVQLTTAFDNSVMFLFCGHGRTFSTYAPPTGYADNAKNSFLSATVYACSKKVPVAGLETPGPWNTTGVNAGADNLLMSVVLKPEP